MRFSVTARNASPFTGSRGQPVTFSSFFKSISEPSAQRFALREIGISFVDESIYVDWLENEEFSFKFNAKLPKSPLFPLSIVVSCKPFIEECINYFGAVHFVCQGTGSHRKLPLCGRATALICGEKHALSGEGASFQNKAVFVLAAFAAAGAGTAALMQLGDELTRIADNVYDGCGGIISYLVHCSISKQYISQTEFWKSRLSRSEWSPILCGIEYSRRLPPEYDQSAFLLLTPSELSEDRNRNNDLLSLSNRIDSPSAIMQGLVSEGILNVLAMPDQWILTPSQGFDIRGRPGTFLTTPLARVVPMIDLAKNISSPHLQEQALRDMGITITGKEIRISYSESGRPFLDPMLGTDSQRMGNDRYMVANATIQLESEPTLPIKLDANFEPCIHDGVNYSGKVIWTSPIDNKSRIIYFIGRATVSLEGHPVFDGNIAGFQSRFALYVAIMSCFGATSHQLESIGEAFRSLMINLHGHEDLLDYTVQSAIYSADKLPSYAAYLAYSYEQKVWSNELQKLIKSGIPSREYFRRVVEELSAEEVDNDRLWTKTNASSHLEESLAENEVNLKQLPASTIKEKFENIYRAREGKKFPGPNTSTFFSIQDVLKLLSNNDSQQEAFDVLGVKFSNDGNVQIIFTEVGNPYTNSEDGDRMTVTNDVIETIFLTLPFNKSISFPLDISVSLDPFVEDYVNYLGKIVAKNNLGNDVLVPITGRATLALEGKDGGDCHAGLATGPACATFQARAAAIFSILFAAGVEVALSKHLLRSLMHVCSCFHGREDALSYTFYCSSTFALERQSFFKWMQHKYPKNTRSSLLKSLVDSCQATDLAIQKVKTKLSADEIREDEKQLEPVRENHVIHGSDEITNIAGLQNEYEKDLPVAQVFEKVNHGSITNLKLFTNRIPLRARLGRPFLDENDKKVSMKSVASYLSSEQSQDQGLALLGIKIIQNELRIDFRERGKPYFQPSGDRTLIGPDIQMRESVEIVLKNAISRPLQITVSFAPVILDNINYAGTVSFHSPNGELREIPLTGKGTIALEGKVTGDAHASLCTGGACATFQQRAALIFAIAAATGCSDTDLDTIASKLKKINDRFHGREEIMFYTLQCAKKPRSSRPSYLRFMSFLYPAGTRSELLESMLDTGFPTLAYYEDALNKLTIEEITEDINLSSQC